MIEEILKKYIKEIVKEEINNIREYDANPIMDTLEESTFKNLKSHVFIEFYYSTEKNFLAEHFSHLNEEQINEEYGVPNGCEEIARKILKGIERKGSYTLRNIAINNDWIKNVNVIIVNNNNISASYLPLQSEIKLENDKYYFYPLVIKINVNENNEEKFVSIMHELTHAYEDYNRKLKNQETLIDNGIKCGYNKNRLQTNNVNEYIISRILYYTYNVERNAFIASMVGELKHCNKYFQTINDVADFLRNTKTYHLYVQVLNWINDLSEIDDIDTQNEILSYVKQLSNLDFNTFNQLVKYFKQKKEEIEKKFNTIIPKIAYEHLNFGGLMMQHNDVLDETIKFKIE